MFEKIYEYVKIYIEPDWTQKCILRINTQVVITAKRTLPPPSPQADELYWFVFLCSK